MKFVAMPAAICALLSATSSLVAWPTCYDYKAMTASCTEERLGPDPCPGQPVGTSCGANNLQPGVCIDSLEPGYTGCTPGTPATIPCPVRRCEYSGSVESCTDEGTQPTSTTNATESGSTCNGQC